MVTMAWRYDQRADSSDLGGAIDNVSLLGEPLGRRYDYGDVVHLPERMR
jgi:hypothetical protein